jgi:hypothetical protein
MDLGSGIRDPGSGKTYSGSRIQGSKRHRIPDPDPHLAILVLHKLGTVHVSIDEEPALNFHFVVHRWNRPVGYEANLEVVAVKYVYGR